MDFRWLAFPLIGFYCLALSNKVMLGEWVIFEIPLSNELKGDLLSPVRSSGRFMWPAAYFLLFLMLRQLMRLRIRAILPVLALIGIAQHLDLWQFSAQMKNKSVWAVERTRFEAAASETWENLLDHADHVVFIPAQMPDNHTFFYELGWRAMGRGVSFNTMYMARLTEEQNAAEEIPVREALRNSWDPRTLYVFHKGCEGVAKHRTNLIKIDGVLVMPPDVPAPVLEGYVRERCR